MHRELAVALAAARTSGAGSALPRSRPSTTRRRRSPERPPASHRRWRRPNSAAATGAHNERAAFLGIAVELLPPTTAGAPSCWRGAPCAGLGAALRRGRRARAGRGGRRAGRRGVAEVAAVLATAGSTTHAWQLAAGAVGPEVGRRWTRSARAALTLLDLERREAEDPEHPGMQLDLPGRREALRVLHRSGRLVRRGDLARYAVAAVHGQPRAHPHGGCGRSDGRGVPRR